MKSIRVWRIIFLLAFACYLINNLYLYLVFESSLSLSSALSLLVFKCLPIVLFVPSVLKPNYKASLFLCLVLLFYVVLIANAMFIDGTRGYLAISEGFIIAMIFTASVVLGKLHKE